MTDIPISQETARERLPARNILSKERKNYIGKKILFFSFKGSNYD
jgi:hypothetical protein